MFVLLDNSDCFPLCMVSYAPLGTSPKEHFQVWSKAKFPPIANTNRKEKNGVESLKYLPWK